MSRWKDIEDSPAGGAQGRLQRSRPRVVRREGPIWRSSGPDLGLNGRLSASRMRQERRWEIVVGGQLDEERHARDVGCARCHGRTPSLQTVCLAKSDGLGKVLSIGGGDRERTTRACYVPGADTGLRVGWLARVAARADMDPDQRTRGMFGRRTIWIGHRGYGRRRER
jgi:hypothetical protein